ncbi:MAG: T9SS type A sorting domain-containing protein, partial [candidate division Zixibacteria bacterium]|nr:T9SS type A sorting domain-containing protein [candidate division Zixibacteria bacterium]
VSSDGPWLWVFDQTNNVSSIAWQFDPVAGEYTGVSIDMTEVTNDIAGGLAFSDEYDPTLGILIGLIQGQGSGFDYLSGYEVAETGGGGEELVYMENFDSGMGDWSGEWGLATSNYHSPPNSLADSPTGNYADYDTVVVEMMTDIDLTNFVGARLEFWTKYDIELGFDYIYLEISADGGMNWNPLETFNGEGVDWTLYNADIGGYAGGSVRFKLTLESDAGYNTDGMYVDDFAVYGTDVDNSPPLILHDAPDEATSAQYDYIAVATISDPSDVQSASLSYSIEGSDLEIAEPDSTVGDDYYFTIPEQDGGTPIMYFFTAEDGEGNTGDSPEYNYVAGTVLYYDDGEAEYIYSYAPGNKLAVRFTPSEPAILVSGLIRLYTDPSNELDTVDVEAWERSGNNPGESLIEPFAVWPTSTLGDPEAFTYADFRGMNVTVDDDFFFGFTYRSGWPVILGDSPGVSGRSRHHNGSSWGDPASDVDYHIRAIVDYDIVGVEDDGEVVPSEYSLKQNYPNPFNAQTTIGYSLRSRTLVKLEVFNLLGQNVATLVDKNQNAGFYSVSWNATDLSSGVYFYKLTAGENIISKRMVLLK